MRCAVLRHCHALRANHATERARRLLSKLRWYVDAVGRGRSVAHSLCNHHLRNCFRPTDRTTDQNELRQIDRALGKAKAALVCDGRSGYVGNTTVESGISVALGIMPFLEIAIENGADTKKRYARFNLIDKLVHYIEKYLLAEVAVDMSFDSHGEWMGQKSCTSSFHEE